MAESRSTFGPAVLVGLAAAGLAALAGARDWVSVDDAGSGDAAFAASLSISSDLSAPPVTATALVVLAAWGVVLVGRGRFRWTVAWLGLLAAVGVLGFAVAAWVTEPGRVADDLRTLDLTVHRSVWSYLGVVAGLLTVVAGLVAVRGVRGWPEMGRRYDAPVAGGGDPVAATTPVEEQSSLDLWKAMDDGHDPTADRPTDLP